MLLFNKKTDRDKRAEEDGPLDNAAQMIAGVIMNRQKQLARYCGDWYASLSLKTKKVLFLLFCTFFGCASLWSLAKGLWPQPGVQATAIMQPNQPELSGRTGMVETSPLPDNQQAAGIISPGQPP